MKKYLVTACVSILLLTAAKPNIQWIRLHDDANGSISGAAVPELVGNMEMTLAFRIGDPEGFDDISMIRLIFWNISNSFLGDSHSDTDHGEYRYNNNDAWDNWSLMGPASWELDSKNSYAPALASNTSMYDCMLVFTLGKQATVSATASWAVTLEVEDSTMAVSNMTVYYSLRQNPDQDPSMSGELKGYPNPFLIGDEDVPSMRFQYAPDFQNTPYKMTLSIYTIYGELVTEFSEDKDPNEGVDIEWNGENDKALPVASGVYTAIIKVETSSGSDITETKSFNFAVFR